MSWTRLCRRLATFGGERGGGVAMIFAIALPALAMLSIGAVELSVLASHKATMQAAADSAALAGAAQLGVAPEGILARTEAFALGQASRLEGKVTLDASAELIDPGYGITITLLGNRTSFFGNLLPPGGFNIEVSATAMTMNSAPLCVLGARSGGDKVINLLDSARLVANGCLVQSNGDIMAESSSRVTASTVQAAGRASGSFTPAAQAGAQIIDDPFAHLNLASTAACTDHGKVKSGGAAETIAAGVHCGKIEVGSNGTLRLAPGEHYFRGAELQIKENATLYGRDVVLIFDRDSRIKFQDQAIVDLEGRQNGPLSGFLIITARDFTNDLEIWSDNVDNLLGVVYAPAGRLMVIGTSQMAEDSDWTVVVAREIQLKGTAQLTINSNYAGSSVPVPTGVGPSGVAHLTD